MDKETNLPFSHLQIGDAIEYSETIRGRSKVRTGHIIEFNPDRSRARIKWDTSNIRTWIRTHALRKIDAGPSSDPASPTLIYGSGDHGKIPTKKHFRT